MTDTRMPHDERDGEISPGLRDAIIETKADIAECFRREHAPQATWSIDNLLQNLRNPPIWKIAAPLAAFEDAADTIADLIAEKESAEAERDEAKSNSASWEDAAKVDDGGKLWSDLHYEECMGRHQAIEERNSALAEIERLTRQCEHYKLQCALETQESEAQEGQKFVAEGKLKAAIADNAALREALTPSSETFAAYAGKFHFTLGDWSPAHFTVPWEAIKEILKAISDRASGARSAPGKDDPGIWTRWADTPPPDGSVVELRSQNHGLHDQIWRTGVGDVTPMKYDPDVMWRISKRKVHTIGKP